MSKQLTLEQARVVKGLTRKEASELIGVSANTILNWEAGKSYPSVFYLPNILKAYELTSIDEILFDLSSNSI